MKNPTAAKKKVLQRAATDGRLSVSEVLSASRWFSWVNTAAPFLVGAYLGDHNLSWALLIGLIYFLFPYNLLVYGVNDIYDYESDIQNPRKGGIEGGIMPKSKHPMLWRVIILSNAPFLIFLLTKGSMWSRVWFLGVIFAALSYSVKGLRFKEVPFLDSFNSSWHFWSPLVYGLLLSGATEFYLPAILAFMFWGMASQALGAVQDVEYDKSAGIGSIAVKLGAEKTGLFSASFYIAAAALPALYYGWAGLVAAALLSIYVWNVVRCFYAKNSALAYRTAWKAFMKLNLLVGFGMFWLLYAVYRPF